jgi:hypothetical protein
MSERADCFVTDASGIRVLLQRCPDCRSLVLWSDVEQHAVWHESLAEVARNFTETTEG